MGFFGWLGGQWRRRPGMVMLAVYAILVLIGAHELFTSHRPIAAAAAAAAEALLGGVHLQVGVPARC